MKILFWALTILLIPVGLFVSFISYVARELGLYGTNFGEAVCIAGMVALVVCVICGGLGIVKLRKGNVKRALTFVLIGVIYCGIIGGLMVVDEVVHTKQLEDDIENRNEELYGENWNSPPAVEGIPGHYEELLNKFYAVVRDAWPAEELMMLGVVSMAEHYGDIPLDNIGFALKDLNGDSVDELIIGTTASVEGGTVIFCICSDPENPHYSISSVEGEIYYLHSGEADNTYVVEIVGRDAAWVIGSAEDETTLDIAYEEVSMDSAGRLTLDLVPFSQYK